MLPSRMHSELSAPLRGHMSRFGLYVWLPTFSSKGFEGYNSRLSKLERHLFREISFE